MYGDLTRWRNFTNQNGLPGLNNSGRKNADPYMTCLAAEAWKQILIYDHYFFLSYYKFSVGATVGVGDKDDRLKKSYLELCNQVFLELECSFEPLTLDDLWSSIRRDRFNTEGQNDADNIPDKHLAEQCLPFREPGNPLRLIALIYGALKSPTLTDMLGGKVSFNVINFLLTVDRYGFAKTLVSSDPY